MKERQLLEIIAVFVVLTVTVQYVATNPRFSDGNEKRLMTLNISGGFAGMKIDVEYYNDGLVVYNNSKTNFERSIYIQQPMIEELTNRIETLVTSYKQGLILEAEPGSADYFNYDLKIFDKGKEIVYQWTDTSKSPPQLSYLASLVSQVNNLAVKSDTIIFFIKIDKTNFIQGEKVLFRVIAINPTGSVYSYQSPTPCAPNFKVTVVSSDGKEIELYPIGFESDKPCTQIVQERSLPSGLQIQSEYEYTLKAQGSYLIKANFPYPDWSDTRYQDQIIVISS